MNLSILSAWATLRRVHLTVWIFIAMGMGILVGALFPSFSTEYLSLLSSSIFLPMIKACIVPLVFSTLVVGIAGHGDDTARIGRMAWKTMLYFLSVTFTALAIGLVMANIIKPGAGVIIGGAAYYNNGTSHISLKNELNEIFQPSFFQAAIGFDPITGKPSQNGGSVLAIVFMALMFSIALMQTTKTDVKVSMIGFMHSLSNVMFSVVNIIMKFAPFGIFGAMAATIGHSGLSVLFSLGKLIACLYISLFVFILIVLVPIMLSLNINPIKFGKAIIAPILIAFATASSDAALPKAMETYIIINF
jgi:proton glutamate symport protein